MFKDTEKTAKFPVTYFVHENTAKTIEVIFPFSHYRCIVTAFKLLLFQTILTERVKGNVRVMLADMEFKWQAYVSDVQLLNTLTHHRRIRGRFCILSAPTPLVELP